MSTFLSLLSTFQNNSWFVTMDKPNNKRIVNNHSRNETSDQLSDITTMLSKMTIQPTFRYEFSNYVWSHFTVQHGYLLIDIHEYLPFPLAWNHQPSPYVQVESFYVDDMTLAIYLGCESFEHVNDTKKDDAWTPLHVAVDGNNVPLCEILIELGANIHAQDVYENTPLHYATEHNSLEICSLLLQMGSSVNIHNALDMTPYDVAICRPVSFVPLDPTTSIDDNVDYQEESNDDVIRLLSIYRLAELSLVHSSLRNPCFSR